MIIAKFNSAGTFMWTTIVGGANNDTVRSIVQAADGGYIVAGLTNSFGTGAVDMYVVKLDDTGNTCGNSSQPSSNVGSPSPTVINQTPTVTTPTPTVTTPTPTVSSGGTVTNICTTVGIEPGSNEIPNQFSLSQNYPNPFNPSTQIRFQIPRSSDVSLKVFDVLGKEVRTLVNERLQPGKYETTLDASDMASGMYFARFMAIDSQGNVKLSKVAKLLLVK